MRKSGSEFRRRAIASVYFVVAWLPLVAVAVLFGVERGVIMAARAELSAVSDAASMAGASALNISPDEVRARAKQIALANKVNGQPVILFNSDIDIGNWDPNTRTFDRLTGAAESGGNAVRVNAQVSNSRGAPLKLIFGGILKGSGTMDLSRISIAQANATANDLMLVQDVTGSFRDEITYARDGDQMLLNSLYSGGGATRMGVVAFTGTAKTLSPLLGVTTNYSTLQGLIGTLDIDGVNMPSSTSCTDIAAGLEQAITTFDGAADTSNQRSIVIVSDGECVASPEGAHPDLTSDQLLDLANHDADTAWSKKINVFVVFWDSANNPDSAAKLSTLVRGEGKFLHVTDINSLSTTIGTQVIKSTKLVK